MSGPQQQCRVVVSLTSRACRAAGEGERNGALPGGIGLLVGLGGG
jgi:hypothetical protein